MPILETSINSPRDDGFKLAARLAATALNNTLRSHELLDKEDYIASNTPYYAEHRGEYPATNQTSLRETLIALHTIMDMESNGKLSGHRIHLECGTWNNWHSWCRSESICFTVTTSVPNCFIHFSISCEYRWAEVEGVPILNLHPKLHVVNFRYPSHGKYGKHRGVNKARWIEPTGVALFPMFRKDYDSSSSYIRFRYWEHGVKLNIALSVEELEQLLKHPENRYWINAHRSRVQYSGYDVARKWKHKRMAKIERSWDEDTDIRYWKNKTRFYRHEHLCNSFWL